MCCTQVLNVHELERKSASQASYLGDIISDKGTIDETINVRSQKALGIITQISSILASVSLGSFHFDIALVLRDALFVNSIMTNSEIWHNVQIKHIENLEKMDLILLRKVLNAHSKTPSEAIYLQLGKYPLRFVLCKRRLMYLWHILHRDKTELIRKIYETQKLKQVKGDWFKILEAEKSKLNIQLTDSDISKMSREKFKSLISQRIHLKAEEYLKKLASGHSKSKGIVDEKFEKKQYFNDRRLSKEDIQILFSLKTKMTSCKTNFKSQFQNNLSCRICLNIDSIEDENHLLECVPMKNKTYGVKFNDVYGDLEKQVAAVKVFKTVLRKRNAYLEMMENDK